MRISDWRSDACSSDLVTFGLLLDLESLLHGVLVEFGEETVDANAVNGVVRLEPPVGGGVGDVLHEDNNVHGGVAGEAPPVQSIWRGRNATCSIPEDSG